MREQTLTVKLEIHDGDVTDQRLWPLGQTAITDVVRASFVDGEWTIAGEVGNVPFAGRAEYKQDAILNYFRARLAIPEKSAGGEV
jgi:hypothetical protein